MNCEVIASLTFTLIKKSFSKWTGHHLLSARAWTVFFRGEPCHLEVLGFYVCSVSSPALALGQYADQYRKAQESHLMSVCRLCLAVLQWLKVVCHDNEIHNAWQEGGNKEATSGPLRERKELEGEWKDDREWHTFNQMLITSCARWEMPTRTNLVLAICKEHKIKIDTEINLLNTSPYLHLFASNILALYIKNEQNNAKPHNTLSFLCFKMIKYSFILLGRHPPNHSVLEWPHLASGLWILYDLFAVQGI